MTRTSQPIPRKKLSDHIQDRLLAIVQGGELSPGDTIPSERELMETFSVGRPAIREAMQNLQRMGLIEIRHGERPRIAEPSFNKVMGQLGETMRHLLTHSTASMEHLKQARLIFEVEMVRIAAERRTVQDVDRLKDILDKQAKASNNSPEFLRQDGNFHCEIAKISGNPIFEGLSKSFFDWLAHFHFDLVRSPGLEKLTLEEHQNILRAIETGNPARAAKELSDHLNRADKLYHQDNPQLKTTP